MTGPDVTIYCGRFDVRCGADQKRAEWTKNESGGGGAKRLEGPLILQGLYIEVDSVAKKSKQLIGIAEQGLMGGCFHAGRVAFLFAIKDREYIFPLHQFLTGL